MITKDFIESDMKFGPYPAGQCFYIEKSACYEKVKEGVKMAEFLLLKQQQQGHVVWVVEAKSSSPRPGTQPAFPEFIDEIRAKLTNGFVMSVAMRLERHPNECAELPEPFKKLDLKTASFRFVLIINGHKDEWLPPLQEKLSLALMPVVKSWDLPPSSVAVLNEIGAQREGLIRPTAGAAP